MSLTDICLTILVLLLSVLVLAAVALSERRLRATAEQIRRKLILSAMGMGIWLAATAAIAPYLVNFESFPPRPFPVLVVTLVAVLILAFTGFGARLAQGLKMAELVGVQAFRLPVELILLGFFYENRIPLQMTFEGRNFDVLSAVSAIVIAPLLARGIVGARTVWIWNLVSLGLLLNILLVAIFCMPGPLSIITSGPKNSLPFFWPGIWILYCVFLAMFGHLLTFRKLLGRPA